MIINDLWYYLLLSTIYRDLRIPLNSNFEGLPWVSYLRVESGRTLHDHSDRDESLHKSPSIQEMEMRISYGWWKKSCTSWYGEIYHYLQGLFYLSQVVQDFFHQTVSCHMMSYDGQDMCPVMAPIVWPHAQVRYPNLVAA